MKIKTLSKKLITLIVEEFIDLFIEERKKYLLEYKEYKTSTGKDIIFLSPDEVEYILDETSRKLIDS